MPVLPPLKISLIATSFMLLYACGGSTTETQITTGVSGCSNNNQNVQNPIMISWIAPTQNEDDSALTDLQGYILYYGLEQNNLDLSTQITDPALNSYLLNLPTSNESYYFSLTAINVSGIESARSNIICKSIT